MPLPDPPPTQDELDRREAHRRAFGDVLRQARAEVGISQEQLAEAAEMSRPTIARLETGSHSVSVDRLWAIAAALHMPAHELVERTEAGAAAYARDTRRDGRQPD